MRAERDDALGLGGLLPSSPGRPSVGYFDASAHRIISDLSAFVGHNNPAKHKILAAGDLNMFYGSIRSRLSMPKRERTVWRRMRALGLEFLGPQEPQGRCAGSAPTDVSSNTKNVPTVYYAGGGPETAVNQLDYAFASRGYPRRPPRVSAAGLQSPANEARRSGPHAFLTI